MLEPKNNKRKKLTSIGVAFALSFLLSGCLEPDSPKTETPPPVEGNNNKNENTNNDESNNGPSLEIDMSGAESSLFDDIANNPQLLIDIGSPTVWTDNYAEPLPVEVLPPAALENKQPPPVEIEIPKNTVPTPLPVIPEDELPLASHPEGLDLTKTRLPLLAAVDELTNSLKTYILYNEMYQRLIYTFNSRNVRINSKTKEKLNNQAIDFAFSWSNAYPHRADYPLDYKKQVCGLAHTNNILSNNAVNTVMESEAALAIYAAPSSDINNNAHKKYPSYTSRLNTKNTFNLFVFSIPTHNTDENGNSGWGIIKNYLQTFKTVSESYGGKAAIFDQIAEGILPYPSNSFNGREEYQEFLTSILKDHNIHPSPSFDLECRLKGKYVLFDTTNPLDKVVVLEFNPYHSYLNYSWLPNVSFKSPTRDWSATSKSNVVAFTQYNYKTNKIEARGLVDLTRLAGMYQENYYGLDPKKLGANRYYPALQRINYSIFELSENKKLPNGFTYYKN